MTLQEAMALGIRRVRKAEWNAYAYLRVSGSLWAHLFDRPAQEVLGVEIPQPLLVIGDDADDWEAYTGLLDKKDEHS